MSDQTANIHLMVKAARAAGRGLMKDFLEVENLQVSKKAISDFVSKADIQAEETIKEILMEGRKNYGWWGEELGRVEGKDATRNWIVDPLDGTTNFLHGLPHWAVSIALEQKGEIVAAVIFDPVKSEIFTAQKGGGAWMNNQRIRVSGRSDFSEMLFATGIPFQGKGNLGKRLREMTTIASASAGIRRYGAAALDLAYVAMGRVDGFWEDGLNAWDIAAGELIVREAGGYATGYDGKSAPYLSNEAVASNPMIHEKLCEMLNRA